MKIIQLEQNTPEWLTYRKDKIMASEVPIILGDSPYKSPFQHWQERVGIVPPQKETPAMRRGKELEPVARDKFIQDTSINMVPIVVESDSYPWMGASLDGISDDRKSLLEIKCNNKEKHEQASMGNIPHDHWLQMQHQMYVSNIEMGYYYSFDGVNGVKVKIFFFPKFVDWIPQLYEFLRGVILLNPPALTDRDYGDMGHSTAWKRLTERYQVLDVDIKRQQEEKDEIRRQLIELCDSQSCKGNGIKLIKTISKGKVMYDTVPELLGVDLDKHRADPITSWRVYVE